MFQGSVGMFLETGMVWVRSTPHPGCWLVTNESVERLESLGGSSKASECSMECMEKLLGEPYFFLVIFYPSNSASYICFIVTIPMTDPWDWYIYRLIYHTN